MNVVGLAIGVVSLWKTCVEIFEVIDSGRKYGMEHEILRVKLEVERIRLVTWGGAVGLSEVEHGRPSPHSARLNQDDVRAAVLGLLGCIQHVFENTKRLQDSYGLRPVTSTPDQADDEGRPTQSQLKIKGFNDNLESLFPDIKRYTSENIRNEINQSEDINALQTLEEATMDQHEDISCAASDRLEVMGATSVVRSRRSWDQHTITDSASQHIGRVNADAEVGAGSHTEEKELDELSKQMEAVELYASNKSVGALTLSLIGPHSYSARVSAHVYWDGRKSDDSTSTWDDQEKGFVKNSHATFG